MGFFPFLEREREREREKVTEREKIVGKRKCWAINGKCKKGFSW